MLSLSALTRFAAETSDYKLRHFDIRPDDASPKHRYFVTCVGGVRGLRGRICNSQNSGFYIAIRSVTLK
jgi:hypothetical protein